MVVRAFRRSLNEAEIRHAVQDFEYLEKQQWYMNNVPLRLKLLDAVRCGLGPFIEVRLEEADLDYELDQMFKARDRKFKYLGSRVPHFEYLETRSWFNRNPELQDKLLLVVVVGQGSKVQVTAPNFDAHLEELLSKK
jgi:hypothetical protein